MTIDAVVARMTGLMRPGPVLLRLAARGFGVRLPGDDPGARLKSGGT